MGIIEGTRALKAYVGDYDFAVDGGANGTIILRSMDGGLPIGSVVWGGYLDVQTACLAAAGTMALTSGEGAADVLAASLQAALAIGRKSIIPAGTGATSLKMTAARVPAVVIAGGAFTAGKFTLVLFYR